MKKIVSMILAMGLLAAVTINGQVTIKSHDIEPLHDLPNQH
ncbi:hypothetical protein [Bacillus sp. ISL-35]|nr:hypothetical protein [Bacillus sp. ISL-35]